MKNIGVLQPSCGSFPIGTIIYTRIADNPTIYFGGTWERIKDVFLYGHDTPNTIYNNSGHNHTTADYTLTLSQLPSHQHQFPFVGNSVADGTSQDQFNFLYGQGQTASAIGQKAELYHTNGSREAEGNEYAYMTNWTGSSQAHNHGNTNTVSNLPPYLAVYVWKRIS